jgi:hypothetical protein
LGEWIFLHEFVRGKYLTELAKAASFFKPFFLPEKGTGENQRRQNTVNAAIAMPAGWNNYGVRQQMISATARLIPPSQWTEREPIEVSLARCRRAGAMAISSRNVAKANAIATIPQTKNTNTLGSIYLICEPPGIMPGDRTLKLAAVVPESE